MTLTLPAPEGDPLARFAELAQRRHCVWLDTAAGQGLSLLAADPARVIRAKGRHITLTSPAGTRHFEANPFDALNAELAHARGTAIGVTSATT